MIVTNLERPHLDSNDETKTDEDSKQEEPIDTPVFQFNSTRYTPTGREIPQENILNLRDFELRDSIERPERTGREPVPTMRSVD